MNEPPVRFVPTPDAPPDDGELADAMATLLIGARRRREQAGDGDSENGEPQLEEAK